jgi:hypothetical protein
MNLSSLEGLTGKARRAAYMALREQMRLAYRAQRRLPTPHQVMIAEMRKATLLPAPGPDLDENERRKIRNKLKAAR